MMKVQVYTTTYCGYCRAAKALLTGKGVAYEEIDCTENPATRSWLVEKSGQRTVPQIFIAEVAIGGFTELAALDRAGKLDQILAGTLPPPSVR